VDMSSTDLSSRTALQNTSYCAFISVGASSPYHVKMANVTMLGSAVGIQANGSGSPCQLELQNFVCDPLSSLASYVAVGVSGCQPQISGARVNLRGPSNTGFQFFGASVTATQGTVTDFVVEPGAGAGSIGIEVFLSTCRVGIGVLLDGVVAGGGTPLDNAGGQFNRGTFNASAGAVDVNFPIQSTERVLVQPPSTLGGTGALPLITPTAGTKVHFAPGVGDTSLWPWIIE